MSWEIIKMISACFSLESCWKCQDIEGKNSIMRLGGLLELLNTVEKEMTFLFTPSLDLSRSFCVGVCVCVLEKPRGNSQRFLKAR